ncbi:hypothetical protein NM208_g8857 [Fusarium decemcellulare]|uniref:Uncharacterized protein n=1 Tax=Fusarium decemcellulare TaxID=57161 RepID=A0ACC1S3X8_9HYPO|nr:hypothetical protein NM208_g8857 [Fusarium decemcellulare]
MASWMNLNTNNAAFSHCHYSMLRLYGTQNMTSNFRRTNLIKPQRTEELQSLYDRWRELENCQKFEQHLQLNDSEHHLQPEGSPQGTSERSPSIVSGHSGVEDSGRTERSQKPRRRGPLSKMKREKTAFIRRLGACPPCRARKVGCKHWDLREFEASYQLSKSTASRNSPAPGKSPGNFEDDESSLRSPNADLFGLAYGVVDTSVSPDFPDFTDDLDQLLATLPSPVSMDNWVPQAPVPLVPQHCLGLDNATIGPDSFGRLQLMRSRSVMAIGKDLACMTAKKTTWQCQFWDGQQVGTISVAAEPCAQQNTILWNFTILQSGSSVDSALDGTVSNGTAANVEMWMVNDKSSGYTVTVSASRRHSHVGVKTFEFVNAGCTAIRYVCTDHGSCLEPLVREILGEVAVVIGQSGSFCLATLYLIEHAERLNLLHLLRHASSESPAMCGFNLAVKYLRRRPPRGLRRFPPTLPPPRYYTITTYKDIIRSWRLVTSVEASPIPTSHSSSAWPASPLKDHTHLYWGVAPQVLLTEHTPRESKQVGKRSDFISRNSLKTQDLERTAAPIVLASLKIQSYQFESYGNIDLVMSQTTLPQGFSVFQPTLGAQLQFFPAIGTRELDELVNAYVPGPASAQEKRASISLDFFEYAHLTGQTFKFYPVYNMATSVESPATASPLQDSGYGSSFNASPVMSNWDWSGVNAGASSRRQSPKSAASRNHTADFSNIPGMKIMTKDGRDVTNSASRGSKTKEQRDHAHLMRIIKACDSCKKKKIRCDPSHKKKGVTHSQAQPASKVTKKTKTIAPEPRAVPAVVQDDLVASLSFPAEQSFSAELDNLTASVSAGVESWEEFIQYPAVDDYDYDFFYDPEGYLSPQSSSSQSAYSTKPVTPTSQQDLFGSFNPGNAEATVASADLPFNQTESIHDYVDFNLYSPQSSFSEDDRMVSIEGSKQSVSQPRTPAPQPLPPAEPSSGPQPGGGDLTGDLGAQFAPTWSTPQQLFSGGDFTLESTYRDPGYGLELYSSPSSSSLDSGILSHSMSSLEETPTSSAYISDFQSSGGSMSPAESNVLDNHSRIVDSEGGTLQSVSTFADVSRPRRPGTDGLDQTAFDRSDRVTVDHNDPRTTATPVEHQSPVHSPTELSSINDGVIANATAYATYAPCTPTCSTSCLSETSSAVSSAAQSSGEDGTTLARDDAISVRSNNATWQSSTGDQRTVVANQTDSVTLNSGSPNHNRRRDVLEVESSSRALLEAQEASALKSQTHHARYAAAEGDEASRLTLVCTIAPMALGLGAIVSIVMMLAAFVAWSYLSSGQSPLGNLSRTPSSSPQGVRQYSSKVVSFMTSTRGKLENLQSKASNGTKSVGRMITQSRSFIAV